MNYSEEFSKKMTSAGMSKEIQSLFLDYYNKLINGDRGVIEESSLSPVPYGTIPSYGDIANYSDSGRALIKSCAIIKLNGGLGTSMGLSGPKSFLPVKSGKTFIDIAVEQVENLSRFCQSSPPLIFMNSSVTDDETSRYIRERGISNSSNIPSSFIHHAFPKVVVETLAPASNPDDTSFEWNPAGHGDIYASLALSGTLHSLLQSGVKYAFISNIDNLGATFDPAILGYMAKGNIPFLMEVCRRREMDKKGGHIAIDKAGNYTLRERAQADSCDIKEFEDIEKYSYFNSNSLWIDLQALSRLIEERGLIKLPLIANRKNLIPTEKDSPSVYQIETAMGAALSIFSGAKVLEIPQSRFLPVKKCSDLLLLQSDRFHLNDLGELHQTDDCTDTITLSLDEEFYGFYSDLQERVSSSTFKLKECERLSISGDISFSGEISFSGNVELVNGENSQKVIDSKSFKSGTFNI